VHISVYCRLVLVPPNYTKFGVRGQLTDVIAKQCQIFSQSVQGLQSSDTPKIMPYPIDLLRRPENSAFRLVWDTSAAIDDGSTVLFLQRSDQAHAKRDDSA